MKYFKASEYRAFLLYYSLPALAGLFPQKYWDHHALLVIAIYWLLQQSISSHQVEVCQTMLNQYCYQFSSLYSERYMTANLHLLLHLPDTVKLLGPLWVYSCFQFEGQNGLLKSMINGTRQVDKQIISTYSYIRNLPLVANSFTERSCEQYLEAFKHLYFKNSMPQHNYLKVNDDVYMIGKPNVSIADTEMLALSLYGIEKCTKFSRMLFCGVQIHSCSWKDGKQQRNNSAIAYYSENHGTIEYGIAQGFFLESGSIVYITIKKLQKHDTVSLKMQSHPHWEVPHIGVCVPPSSSCPTIAIPLSCVRSSCVCISFSDIKECIYLAIIVNRYEKD